ncbi:MAG TPA: AAA family ATPase [Allosphingosinicella sp.]|nr:AAA family ATPase [Allosphingosinicella sp.]
MPVSSASGMGSPYPGLRPFNREEAHLFYGRENCVESMVGTLEETHFMAVLGPSGSGKSSLVRSGLFIHLEAGLARKAGSRWTFLDIRHPRQQPYRELARELLREERRRAEGESDETAAAADLAGGAAQSEEDEVEARRKELRRNPLTLVKWWEERRPDPDDNLLLLVDQFEELFGYGQSRERDDVEAFVDLLLKSARSNRARIYIVLTMRSEFLGGCTLFPGLAEQINRSLSLLPRMTREECEDAIVGPADGENLLLEPLLIATLLNDMNALARWMDDGPDSAADVHPAGNDPTIAVLRQADLISRRADQLPLMQHVLNWMWRRANARRSSEDEPVRLTLEDYVALGGLRGAVTKHAREVMDSTGDPDLTERIFRALTDQPSVATSGSAESSAVRRPRSLAQLTEETGADEDRIRGVVDAFRTEGVSMLTPGRDTPLTGGREVDIAHESLIRQWTDLREWIREEGERGRSWLELVRNVEQEDKKEAELLRGLELSERRRWWERSQPQPGWADRYEGRFEEVDNFLNRSIRAERWRKRLQYGGTGGLVLIAGVAGFLSLAAGRDADAAGRVAQSARNQATMSLAAAAKSRTEAAAASRVRRWAEARLAMASNDAAAARRAEQAARVAAASARGQMQAAAASVAQARIENVETRAETARMREMAVGMIYSDRLAPRIRQASGDPNFRQRLPSLQGEIQVLENLDSTAFAAANIELRLQQAEMEANELNVATMQSLAQQVKDQAEAQPPSVDRALWLSRANILLGRAQLLQNEPGAAEAAFRAAIEQLGTLTNAASAASAPDGATAANWTAGAGGYASAMADPRHVVANARYGRTLALLELNNPAAAAEAASCVAGVGQGPISPDLSLARAQCLSLSSAAAASDEQAIGVMEEAAEAMVHLPANVDPFQMSVARSELLLRFLTRYNAILARGADYSGPTRNLEMLMLGLAMNSSRSPGLSVPTPSPVPESGNRMYIKDALEQAAVIGRFLEMESEDSPIQQILLGRSEALLAVVETNFGQNGDRRAAARVSQVFELDAANRTRMIARATDLDWSKVLSAINVMDRHRRFLAPLSGAGVEGMRGALRRQALGLFAVIDIDKIRYPGLLDLPAEVEDFVSRLCPAGALEVPECRDLITAGDSFRAAAGARRDALAAMVAPVRAPGLWVDEQGIALAGFDPVSCAALASSSTDRRGSGGARALSDDAEPSGLPGARADPSGWGLQTCALRRGFYLLSTMFEGRVWLFESSENRRSFMRNPNRYIPRLGGYDTLALAGDAPGRVVEIEGDVYGAVSPLGNLYLFSDEVSAATAPRRAISSARRNWKRDTARQPERRRPQFLPSTR